MPGVIPPKTNVLGVGVSRADYGQILRLAREWIAEKRAWERSGSPDAAAPSARYTAIMSVHPIMLAYFDPAYRNILNGADLVTSDGMPLVWAARSLGAPMQRRVYGPDLMIALCGQAQRLGHRVFLYGGREDTLPLLRVRLAARLPGLAVVGAYSPPFRPLTPQEDRAAVEAIRASGADIVFCGIGAPKQERWMAEHAPVLPGCLLLGVGAAFDFHAGRVKQAPRWMQRNGLEWLFRLGMEPRRLWRRYLVVNPMFLLLWALQRAGLLHRPAVLAEKIVK